MRLKCRILGRSAAKRRFYSDFFPRAAEARSDADSEEKFSAPSAPRRSFFRSHHGISWDDPYHWLRDCKDPAVKSYLEAENRHAQLLMSPTRALQKQLRREMAARMEQELASPPERWGNWLYSVHIPQGKEFPVYSRRKNLPQEQGRWKSFCKDFLGWDSDKEDVEVLIDINALAEEHGYAELGVFKMSKDHKRMAYTIDLTGDELFTLFLKDLETGCMFPESIHRVVSVEWSQTGQSLYYTSANDARRPFKVSLHNLGSAEEDAVVFQDEDPKNFADVTRTKDWQYILVNVNSKISSEVYLINPSTSPTALQCVRARTDGVQYFVEHHQSHLYILTNSCHDAASNYRLIRCKVENTDHRSWEEIVAADSECWIEDMDIFEKHLVLYRRRNGLPTVHIMNLDDRAWTTLRLPPNAAVITPGANSDFNSSTLRLSFSSLVMPEATYDVDMKTGDMTLLRRVEIPETGSYVMEHHTALSHDNVAVPLTIIYSKLHDKQKGDNPALVIGYGAYGELIDLSFSSDRLSLLDRGWVIAFAHVRGSGTLGKAWHVAGKLLSKKNSFNDFVSCTEYLVENSYASRSKLAAWGESAGGLLIAGAVNLNPELFKAVILKVPFLDILNTMMDSSLNLTEHEYDEWGNPSDKASFEYIRAYSPYDNIKSKASYPAMLVTASFQDTRVGYWEAAKWVAALRHEHSSSKLMLRTSMIGGHFGDGGRYSHLKETAYDYAFLIHAMNNSF